jgi:uncharacterized protein (DUF1778 family)
MPDNPVVRVQNEVAASAAEAHAHFLLSPEKWADFCAALDAPPRELPELRKLLLQPVVFDVPQ